MIIWRLGYTEEIYTYSNSGDYTKYFMNGFVGKSMKENWEPVAVELINRSVKKYDFTAFGSPYLIFNEKVLKALEPIIRDKVEYLPIAYKAENLCFINVLNMVDCLDYKKAIVDIHEKYKVVTKIKKYAFQEELLLDEVIFKIPEFKSYIFVTDKFRNVVLENGLTGFEFEEVWNSEEDESLENEMAPIMKYEGKAYKFVEALDIIEIGEKAMASDRYILQNDDQNRTFLGILLNNRTYNWIEPIGFPPTFVEMDWYLIEKIKVE